MLGHDALQPRWAPIGLHAIVLNSLAAFSTLGARGSLAGHGPFLDLIGRHLGLDALHRPVAAAMSRAVSGCLCPSPGTVG